MATVLNIKPQKLAVMLFGQRLDFEKSDRIVKCVAHARPFPSVTEDPNRWIEFVNKAIEWFDSSSPRAQFDANPCFGQHIRFTDNVGQTECRVLHDGTPGAKEVPEQVKTVLTMVRDWFAI